MASDAVSLIKNDHRLIEKLFEQLKSGTGDRRELVSEVGARLTAHSRAEEQEVYRALAKADPAEQDEVAHSVEEHHEAEKLMHRLERTRPDSADFDRTLAELVGAVMHHVEEEESRILPALAEVVDPAGLERLGTAFERMRMEELGRAKQGDGSRGGSDSRAGKSSAGKDNRRGQSRGSTRGSRSDLANASRDELYERAKRADIKGRSSMNKQQLIDALSKKS